VLLNLPYGWSHIITFLKEISFQRRMHKRKTQDPQATSKDNIYISILKRYWPLVVLFAFCALGLYLRLYHIDYPVVGYHNWKEIRYITAARHFAEDGFFKWGFFVSEYDIVIFGDNPNGVHGEYFPFCSAIPAIFMKVFGMKLWAARLPAILLTTISIALVYFLIYEIFNRKDIALVAAFLTAINPLLVFFSHNVQSEPYGFFFMVAALLFFVYWVKHDKPWYLILATLFATACFLDKPTFWIVGFIILGLFPYKRLFMFKKYLKLYVICFLMVITIPIWYYYSTIYIARIYQAGGEFAVPFTYKELFTSEFMAIMKSFVADNFTMLGFIYAICGLILSFVFLNKNDLYKKFLLSYIFSLVLYLALTAANMKGHNYHQFPFILLVVTLMAYLFITLSVNIALIISSLMDTKKYNTLIRIAIIFFFMVTLYKPGIIPFSNSFNSQGSFNYGGITESTNRMFDVQFLGLDVAGEYIHEHKYSNDWLINSGNQAFGEIWHGDIKGLRNIPGRMEEIKYCEDVLNATWLFIYQWDFSRVFQMDTWPYYAANYKLKQIGFIPQGNNPPNLLYLLLRREPSNESFDVNKLNEYVQGKPVMKKQYEYTYGNLDMYYINT
jgi:4-amino-4-deoxy-L-arabinose transferase-like glycosyltransferase